MAQKFQVCIIGGGVVGMMAALTIARTLSHGKKPKADAVCLVDRNFHGVPRQHPAPLMVHGHTPKTLPLYRYSLGLWQKWAKDFSAEDWGINLIGSAIVARTPAQLQQLEAWTKTLEGLKGEVITNRDILRSVLRQETLPDDVLGALVVADEGYMHSALLYDTLRKLLIREGVIVWGGDDVRYVLVKEDKVVGIQTQHDELFADNIVLCGSLSADQFIKQHKLKMPLRPARCHTIACSPTDILPPQLVAYPTPEGDIYSRPSRTGHQIVTYTGHMDQAQATPSRVVDMEAVSAVMTGVSHLFNGFRHAMLQDVKAITLAITPDGAPYIGAVGALKGLYVMTGMGANTYAYAAGAAKIMADIITGKTPEIDAAAFNPDRYL